MIGKLLLRIPQYKFPGYFLRNGYIVPIDEEKANEDLRNIENYHFTEKAYTDLSLEVPVELKIQESLVKKIEEKYSYTNLGVFGKKGNSEVLKKNLKKLKEKTKFTDDELLKAIDLYLSEVENKKYCRQADYTIFKDGEFFILEYLERVKNGEGSEIDQINFL